MKQAKVLLLEDELQLAKIVSESLQTRGFIVTHVVNGVLGTEAIRKSAFDICIVDVMMPFMDGFTFVEQVRKTDKQVPVLFLTAKSQTEDVIKGYEAGGNDYLRKPFSLEELILRLNELLRRKAAGQTPSSTDIGQYTFDMNKQELWFSGRLTGKLSHRENELLTLLIQHKNLVLDRKAVLLKLWGDDNFFNTRTMDVFITKLRKHLQQDPSIEIINIRGVGYKLTV
ncbi:response regulator transcription factor [Mucilaginibacter sp. OK098]|uniref:response regulator transcription factor n=1 Tax=Mucilaginibacter sp. OK098 TaxID=1855297 RepID=UPI000920CDA8|nr:response regulator transcription factor [Mucilaginibacter sp. OK098]SHN32051.1 DNA-binding response regulator, OmpR family, contains REC and winged-helix (wHTH) domain [Mucilaginibacter sp. OK098]